MKVISIYLLEYALFYFNINSFFPELETELTLVKVVILET